jgi:hypothetical protein
MHTDLSEHIKSNGIPSEPLYDNVENNGLTRLAGFRMRAVITWTSFVRGGDSQHSCGEGECSDENGFEVHIVIKMKEVFS